MDKEASTRSTHVCDRKGRRANWYVPASAAPNRLRYTPFRIGVGQEIVTLDGSGVSDKDSFLRAAARALKFPSYFGKNWDAFEECLSDLEWLPAGGLILFITQSDRLLEESPDDLRTFGDVLRSAAGEWKKSHPRAPHSIVLHVQTDGEGEARQRLAAAGLLAEAKP